MKIDSEVCQKEYTFFDNFDVGLQDKLLLQWILNHFEKLNFLNLAEWSLFFNRLIFDDIIFELLAELPANLIVALEPIYGRNMVVELLIFLAE